MAASSSSIQGLVKRTLGSSSFQENPLWNADVSANHERWNTLESGRLEKKIMELKRIFHRDRQLWVRQLPRNTTENDIRQLMTALDIQVDRIHLAMGPGSFLARVSLADVEPDFWEEWPGSRDPSSWIVRGQRVCIIAGPTENLLCVARLPRECDETQFRNLVTAYGETRRSFLMCSEKTGEWKGYGFVEFVHKEVAVHARERLNGRNYEGRSLICDWLDSSVVTFAGLHSKLLYVDNIPPGFRDMGEFRRLFSRVTSPPYCQIALRGGAPQDWGLVEFSKGQEAEDTQKVLDGVLLRGSRLRVAFFIPAVRAINIYMKLLNDENDKKGKAALLPEPPTDTVLHQLQNLTKQNPAFVHSLQNIIMDQIHTLQSTPPAKLTASNEHRDFSGPKGRGHHPNHSFKPDIANQNDAKAALAANAQAALSLLVAAQQPSAQAQQSITRGYSYPGPTKNLPTDVSVPPPPLPSTYFAPKVESPPAVDIQQTITALVNALSSAVQSLTSSQGSAGTALISLLVRLLQSTAESGAQQTTSPFVASPLSWSPTTLQNAGAGSIGSTGSQGSSPMSSGSPSTSPGQTNNTGFTSVRDTIPYPAALKRKFPEANPQHASALNPAYHRVLREQYNNPLVIVICTCV